MKKKLHLTILLAIFCLSINAQITFQKTYGDTLYDGGYDVHQTTDGGYIISAMTSNPADTTFDMYLIKTDVSGDTLWTRVFSGTGHEELFSVQQTTDGGFIMAGYNDFGVFVVKTDINGDTLWTKGYGSYNDFGIGIQQTSDGGYIIVGNTLNFGAGDWDVYLLKIDEAGNLLWTKTFGGIALDGGQSYGLPIQQTTDGGYIITGETGTGGIGNWDYYLIKTDINGDTLWTKALGGTARDIAYSVIQTTDGGYITAGYTDSYGAGSWDAYIIKTDGNGIVEWSKTYGGTGNEGAYSVQQTSDGGFIISGWSDSFGTSGVYNTYLIKTNNIGDTLWTKTYAGQPSFGGYAQQTTDGGYIITGDYDIGSGNFDVYLIKTDSLGNSGCNQFSTNTIVTSPSTISANTATQVSSGGSASNPAILISSRGIVNTLCTTVGLNDNNIPENFINVYPNPFSLQTTFRIDKSFEDATLIVYNSFGQQVKEIKNIFGQTVIFSRDNLASGLYFIRMTQDGKTFSADKLVIID